MRGVEQKLDALLEAELHNNQNQTEEMKSQIEEKKKPEETDKLTENSSNQEKSDRQLKESNRDKEIEIKTDVKQP